MLPCHVQGHVESTNKIIATSSDDLTRCHARDPLLTFLFRIRHLLVRHVPRHCTQMSTPQRSVDFHLAYSHTSNNKRHTSSARAPLVCFLIFQPSNVWLQENKCAGGTKMLNVALSKNVSRTPTVNNAAMPATLYLLSFSAFHHLA